MRGSRRLISLQHVEIPTPTALPGKWTVSEPSGPYPSFHFTSLSLFDSILPSPVNAYWEFGEAVGHCGLKQDVKKKTRERLRREENLLGGKSEMWVQSCADTLFTRYS